MFQWILKKFLGTRNQREVSKLLPIVAKINEIEKGYQSISESELIAKTAEFKKRITDGESLDQVLPEAFATVKNACRRFTESRRPIKVRGQEMVWEMLPYDVQMIGGMVLHSGRISEMATGEGKTLVATFPAYLNALTGKGVHIVTVNDYLACRDSEWVGEVFRYLGLSVGCVQHDMNPSQRREQYACDITYGTNSEFGFDYLRDNGMATRKEEQVQRGHAYAIIDEVDSILIDEARTPLIISGPVTVSTHQYDKYRAPVEKLVQQQNIECTRWAMEAKKMQEEKKDISEIGRLLFKIKLTMPRNKQLMKLVEDPELLRAVEDAELSMYNDPRRTELYKIKEEAYFTIEEKSSEVDISEKGRQYLNPTNPDAFTLPDLLTRYHEIDADQDLAPEAREKAKAEAQTVYEETSQRVHNITQLLRAFCLFEKDVHYVIQENKVMIVDEFTGRMMPGRRWSDGLHQAIEAKEGVHIDRESQTLATITIQNYFRLYSKLSGMTGTAETEANEFHDIYTLDVVVIPTHRDCVRIDVNDSIFKTRRSKFNAIVQRIKERHEKGQPILVGTISVETSEVLSRMLKRENIIHNVLNAKYHQQEAEIVARAGQKAAVTIATNMAGRGTDIKLAAGVPEVGGLYVIGTERHESRRIDRQLRGRCARQGDPGETQFFISFEDDLMRNFGDSRRLSEWMTKFGMKDDEELEHSWLNKAVESAQKRVEQRNYMIRKHTLQYDDVMNQQRNVVYGFRTEVLETDAPRESLFEIVEEVVSDKAQERLSGGEADPDSFLTWVNLHFPLGFNKEEIDWNSAPDAIASKVLEKIKEAYDLKVKSEDPLFIQQMERSMVLTSVDRLWQEHLFAMDGLRTSVGLRAYGQKDPLIEYKQEAFLLFQDLMGRIKEDITSNLFKSSAAIMEIQKMLASIPQKLIHESIDQPHHSVGSGDGEAPKQEKQIELNLPIRRQGPKLGRNDACPIDPNKKFKNCCGANGDKYCTKVAL
ncbi:MAG: preprotein translocase subunit SecA [Verrucomicrobiota bacterium]